jgi:hypothetical protein
VDVFTATIGGPPAGFNLDGQVYPLNRRWGPLLRFLPAFEKPLWPIAVVAAAVEPYAWPQLEVRMFDRGDGFDLRHLHAIAAGLVEAATGRPYYVAGRLLGWAINEWGAVDGELTLAGVNLPVLFDTAPARAVSVLEHLVMRGADDKQRFELEAALTVPPRITYAEAALWTADDEGSSFLAAIASGPTRR